MKVLTKLLLSMAVLTVNGSATDNTALPESGDNPKTQSVGEGMTQQVLNPQKAEATPDGVKDAEQKVIEVKDASELVSEFIKWTEETTHEFFDGESSDGDSAEKLSKPSVMDRSKGIKSYTPGYAPLRPATDEEMMNCLGTTDITGKLWLINDRHVIQVMPTDVVWIAYSVNTPVSSYNSEKLLLMSATAISLRDLAEATKICGVGPSDYIWVGRGYRDISYDAAQNRKGPQAHYSRSLAALDMTLLMDRRGPNTIIDAPGHRSMHNRQIIGKLINHPLVDPLIATEQNEDALARPMRAFSRLVDEFKAPERIRPERINLLLGSSVILLGDMMLGGDLSDFHCGVTEWKLERQMIDRVPFDIKAREEGAGKASRIGSYRVKSESRTSNLFVGLPRMDMDEKADVEHLRSGRQKHIKTNVVFESLPDSGLWVAPQSTLTLSDKSRKYELQHGIVVERGGVLTSQGNGTEIKGGAAVEGLVDIAGDLALESPIGFSVANAEDAFVNVLRGFISSMPGDNVNFASEAK